MQSRSDSTRLSKEERDIEGFTKALRSAKHIMSLQALGFQLLQVSGD
jgi:hypothetical protein